MQMAMLENAIGTEITPTELDFQPGGPPATFEVWVVNESDRFAGFQIEVQAAGADSNYNADWYRISPEVSTKNPPGDSTLFQVALIDNPVPGFVGMMNLTVRVFSLDLADEDRQVIRVNVQQGNKPISLKLNLPVEEFRAAPNDLVEIPVEVYNPSQLPTTAQVLLKGLPPTWLVQGGDRQLNIGPGKEMETSFTCQLPETIQTRAQTYPLQIIATHAQGPPAEITANLDVLPQGRITFATDDEQEYAVPPRWGWLPSWHSPWITYLLELNNQSNLIQQLTFNDASLETVRSLVRYRLEPETLELQPGEVGQMDLGLRLRRPWWGRPRHLALKVDPRITDERLGDTTPGFRSVKLRIAPMIPFWLSIAVIPLLLYLLWAASWLNPNNDRYGHQAAVNSVDLNGVGNKMVSGSSDQDIRGWNVKGFFVPWARQDMGVFGKTQRAVRVVRFRPVQNDQVAAGLENGTIQLWHLRHAGSLIDNFFYREADRVLALQYERDARFLWSGHGSGLVLRWPMREQAALRNPSLEPVFRRPDQTQQFDFAVYALAFVASSETLMAVAGRYNQLVLWDTQTNTRQALDYRAGGKDDYILSVSVANEQPTRLATADNQGWITILSLENCLVGESTALPRLGDRPCEIIDQWQTGHDQQAVQTVSLSEDGCYLASGGEDGWVRAWPLNPNGSRASQYAAGVELSQTIAQREGQGRNRRQVYPAIRQVQAQLRDDRVLIASGSDDTRVRVDAIDRLPALGCDQLHESIMEEHEDE
ncbi:MAG: hypothetical protein ACPGVO_08325 [Spirulinaceae cyanobacterium]